MVVIVTVSMVFATQPKGITESWSGVKVLRKMISPLARRNTLQNGWASSQPRLTPTSLGLIYLMSVLNRVARLSMVRGLDLTLQTAPNGRCGKLGLRSRIFPSKIWSGERLIVTAEFGRELWM